MYNIFYMLLLEQNIIRKRWVDKKIKEIEFNAGYNNKEYKVKAS